MHHAFSIAAQQISIYSVFLKLFSFWIQMASSMALSFSPMRLLFLTLIFLIDAGSDAVPDIHSHRQRRHTAIVVSSIVAACAFLCLLVCFLFVCCYRRRQRKQRKRLNRDIFERLFSSNFQTNRNVTVGVAGQATKYARWDLEKATDSFSADNIIGSSNISTVYKGVITRGFDGRRNTIIALEILIIENTAQVERFLNTDVDVLSRIKHRNLVEVVGSSRPGDQIVALVTKFVPNGNLDTAIHSVEEGCGLPLNLTKRLNIIISTAQTIVYLHNLCDSPIVHCHLRPTNILLDEDFEVRLSDYGTADMLWSHLQLECIASSSASGAAIGYIAPEVAVVTSQVSPKADVYSFGVILMELLTKRRPIISIVSEGGERISLRQWIATDINGGGVTKLVDPALAENISEKEGEKMINLLKISLLCTKETPDDRPSMSQVLSWLVNIKQGRMECNLGF